MSCCPVIKHRAPNGALRLRRGGRDLACLDGHKAPSAKRHIKTGRPRSRCRTRNLVIKHRAPNGALRPAQPASTVSVRSGHKGPSIKRSIKTSGTRASSSRSLGHKAPSAKRRIKTAACRWTRRTGPPRVIKHRAPSGALRLLALQVALPVGITVRQHQAPNGALGLGSRCGASLKVNVVI